MAIGQFFIWPNDSWPVFNLIEWAIANFFYSQMNNWLILNLPKGQLANFKFNLMTVCQFFIWSNGTWPIFNLIEWAIGQFFFWSNDNWLIYIWSNEQLANCSMADRSLKKNKYSKRHNKQPLPSYLAWRTTEEISLKLINWLNYFWFHFIFLARMSIKTKI